MVKVPYGMWDPSLLDIRVPYLAWLKQLALDRFPSIDKSAGVCSMNVPTTFCASQSIENDFKRHYGADLADSVLACIPL
eukprot:1650321-Pleurochrysis_carterae.AAC.1